MGLLSTGTSLTWSQIQEYIDYIKTHGIIQFLHIFNNVKERDNDLLKFGDEIEYNMVFFDHARKSVRCDSRSNDVLELLQEEERSGAKNLNSLWRPEYGSYMIEGTPGQPFCCSISRVKLIETSMLLRKKQLQEALAAVNPDLTFITYSAFPRVGCTGFTEPEVDLNKQSNEISKSVFFPDEAIFPDHPRYRNLTRNIRTRRGKKQKIHVPVWFDKNTQTPFYDPLPDFADTEAKESVLPNHVYMDCMGFGMGCSCLQVTVQACNLMESRFLYDQLSVIASVLMPLSACSPAWKGVLCEWDCRWKVISMACDDRFEEELTGSDTCRRLRKSRYDCVDMYIHPDHEKFNDVEIVYSPEHYKSLLEGGVDPLLATHIAHLFNRDPISCFLEKIHIKDDEESDHFENIQSTNWQSCRFKPPPPKSSIGWRVEFRTLEVQFTCFENAAFVIFVILLSRAVIKLSLDLILPISLVEHNLDRAIYRDAVNKGKFYFRKDITSRVDGESFSTDEHSAEMSCDEIFNGKENGFVGLIPIIIEYLGRLDLDQDTRECIARALEFIGKRASGALPTPATWIRNFVINHPKYQQDSLVSEEILYDMSCMIRDMADGKCDCTSLLGDYKISELNPTYVEAYKRMINIEALSSNEKCKDEYKYLLRNNNFEDCSCLSGFFQN